MHIGAFQARQIVPYLENSLVGHVSLGRVIVLGPRLVATTDPFQADLVRAAQEDYILAAKEKAKLEIELEAVQRRRTALPWEFEELEELYRIISSDSKLLPRLAIRAVLVFSVIFLLLKWRNDGLESVAGCLLMPLVCATGLK